MLFINYIIYSDMSETIPKPIHNFPYIGPSDIVSTSRLGIMLNLVPIPNIEVIINIRVTLHFTRCIFESGMNSDLGIISRVYSETYFGNLF